MLALATVLALASPSAAQAYWQVATSTAAAAVPATIGASISSPTSAYTLTGFSNTLILSPLPLGTGASVGASAAPLTATTATIALAAGSATPGYTLTVSAAQTTSGAACSGVTSWSTVTLGTALALAPLSPAAATQLCLRVVHSGARLIDARSTFSLTVTLTNRVGTNWTAQSSTTLGFTLVLLLGSSATTPQPVVSLAAGRAPHPPATADPDPDRAS